MALIVQKYGGAVLSDIAKIRSVAGLIANLHSQGNQVVVVVSAMGHTTDDLVRLAYSVSRRPPKREMDMLLSVGERITMSLLSMAIQDTGKARSLSLTGSQVGIITDNRHSDARIVEIRGHRIRKALDEGYVVVVAGFQGVSVDKEITTLGRGGSDTTAVALAAALEADRCDLIKEVPGIFTGDPTVIPEAIRIPELDYASARGLSLGGARILKNDCIDLAERYGIEIRVGTPQSQTIVKQKTTTPFFAVALEEKIISYKIRLSDYHYLDLAEIDGFWGYDELNIFVKEAFELKLPEGAEIRSKRENLSRITALGEGVENIPEWLKQDQLADKIEYCFFRPNEMRVIFSASHPRKALREVHKKLSEKINM